MSVDEMISKRNELDEAERRPLLQALERLEVGSPEIDSETLRRGLAAMEELMNGLCTGGGRH